ncbi:uncharacterized protein K444DRAFT_712134 [Hyaloscypha bicolor E]|uniref:Heterokaryon incompatibility domain-containing protein n=1 Tax=Hyaloscypha bicolor E TaxID=1095630 RepID=A0A2J6SGU8_9HELO|nr:uncharacterized protein K444DRAFT_712134 [Hyaloscypha bicolor E]PMD49977.1 hypothetical protein K444DRAFT_712134 [Hyaloscypha bicolor E]
MRLHGQGKQTPYAILSHTWGAKEVSFKDIQPENRAKKKGFVKIQGCCNQARLDGYDWVWVDSCCIDKSRSAELTEVINSMFKWYHDAGICYTYLGGVPRVGFDPEPKDLEDAFSKSRWFTQGWTL